MTVSTHSGTPRAADQTRGRIVDAFTAGLLQRIQHAETNLHRARETGDMYTADVEQSELDDLRRIAAEHGVQVGSHAV